MKKDEKPSNSLNNYIVDTNVIVEDPDFISKINPSCKVYVSEIVLTELDELKHRNPKLRQNINKFSKLCLSGDYPNLNCFSHSYDEGLTNDEKIISDTSLFEATLLTSDLLMSLKAKSMGIPVAIPEAVYLKDNTFQGVVNDVFGTKGPFVPNEYIVNKAGIWKNKNGKLIRLKDEFVWNLQHKNLEQRCAIDALLDDSIQIVTIDGKAGTGKTLLAIAAAMQKVINEGRYHSIMVSRPIVPMGRELGYLPGEIDEKLKPWMSPIFDNISYLFRKNGKKAQEAAENLISDGLLQMEPITFIRGRSIPNKFIIIDEAQNLTLHEIKTILSRVGDSSKIIMTGDTEQIDHEKLNQKNNGLAQVIKKFKNEPIAAHITLKKCERSKVAELSSKIL